MSDTETALPVTRLFAQDSLIGSRLAGGIATGFTDCHIHADGFGRILSSQKGSINPQQTGRMVQRLLEIETYRTMALLGLPHAREAAPLLAEAEHRLGESRPPWPPILLLPAASTAKRIPLCSIAWPAYRLR